MYEDGYYSHIENLDWNMLDQIISKVGFPQSGRERIVDIQDDINIDNIELIY